MPGYIFKVLFNSDDTIAYTGFSFKVYLNTTGTQTTTTVKPTTTTVKPTTTTTKPTTTGATTTTKATTTIATTTTAPAGNLTYKFNVMLRFCYFISSIFLNKI
jgi:hypothetical protein